jgi:PAS domain S-box-containing protein
MNHRHPPTADLARESHGGPGVADGPGADTALRESEQRFRQIAETINHVFWVTELRPVERVSYVSPAFERIWGRSADALYADARLWMQYIHADDRAAVGQAFEHWLSAPEHAIFAIEYRIVRPDGELRWIADRGQLARDADGNVYRATGVAEDITPRKLAQAHAREMEQQFQVLAESLPQLVWASDPQGACDYLSPQWITYTGLPTAVQLGDGWVELLHPDDRSRVTAQWLHSVQGGHAFDGELRLRRHDGQHRWFMTRALPQRDDTGRVLRWFGTCTDIQDVKESAAALQLERDRIARIAEVAPVVVCAFRRAADGRVSFPLGTERVAAFYGLPPAQIVSDAAAVMQAMHPDDSAGVVARIEESARTLTPFHAEFRVQHPQRGLIWVDAHSMPVAEPEGAFIWHGTITDITERKRTEAELLQLNTRLEQRVTERTTELREVVRELEAFSYSVSHDLRAPLRALDGFSQALLQDHGAQLPETGQRYLKIIRESAQKMGQLIDDLLAFSRVGRQQPKLRTVDHALLVRSALQQLEPMRAGRSVELRIGALPASEGDPAMLLQVWVNLLSNALKYSRNNPAAVVEVGAQPGPEGAAYFVRDNGTGFDMRYAHKLFGVFERLHRSEDFEGTGVGLAIVQRIVQRHGGSVRAESQLGRGATFSFQLGRLADT